MSFVPITPLGGFAGWKYLNKTLVPQTDTFARSPEFVRDTQSFREKIAGVKSAEDLVGDRSLLKVALGAFGLDDDINKNFFIRKVLEEGTLLSDAFANRLVDKRYAKMSEAFGFGSLMGARTADAGFAEGIIGAYKERQFEIAVGNNSESLRLALTFRREIGAIAGTSATDKAKWFTLLGNPPMRKVVEDAFNLPSAFAALDLDRQVETLREKMLSKFGETELSAFQSDDAIEGMIQQFISKSEIASGYANGVKGSTALMLLQSSLNGGAPGSSTIESLFSAMY